LKSNSSQRRKVTEAKRRAEQEDLKKKLKGLQNSPWGTRLLQRLDREANRRLNQLEKERRTDRVSVVIDMDAFFAAIEERDDPKLKEVGV
jgi:uncharacterized sporulation protein YeaH/YhbH (DUF444 family)